MKIPNYKPSKVPFEEVCLETGMIRYKAVPYPASEAFQIQLKIAAQDKDYGMIDKLTRTMRAQSEIVERRIR